MKASCRNLVLGSLAILLLSTNSYAQHRMESLDRGTVAVPTSAGTLVNWRITGPEYGKNATYNLYRGTKQIATGLSVSNYVDAASNGEGYSVAAVISGVEQSRSTAVAPLSKVYFTIPVRAINGAYDAYEINDASVGDLDGDGQYEIVIKRLANDATPAATTYHYLEAYKLDGTFLWAINLGPNMINKVEVNFLVYDLDGDGKAEVATRTSDGFTDGAGTYVGDRDGDGQASYRATAALNSSYYRIDGPDYISIFEGKTGKELAWSNYIAREPMSMWGTSGMSDGQLSHRAEKCMWSVAYLDGVNPSFIITRGIYHRIKLEAWHYRSGKLAKEWAYDSDPNGVASTYTGSGYHNFIVGDVDADGRDEIMYGSMGVDEYGKGMYSTGYGHGDAQHLADINPDIKGLEHFACLEGANGSTIPGMNLRNATTGASQWKLAADGDIGRCMTADIDPNYKGYEMWSSANANIYSATGTVVSTTQPTTAGGGATYNFGIWWDGDVQREFLDRTVITKWNATNKATDRVATLYNIASVHANNDTKSNPSLQADILGDWREEAIFPSADNTGLVVFLTPFSTTQRMYTLMHDPNYRDAISWQQNSYNQPPNLGFYFGSGMTTPTAPNITIVEPTSVALTFPADKASSRIGETVALTANATASQGTASVTFYATAKSTMTMTDLGTDAAFPYSINWTPTATGTYYIVAKVTDGHGVTIASNIITYTVTASAPQRFIYELDSGATDMSWKNTGNWTPSRLPTDIDTAVIRTGEAQLDTSFGGLVIVEPNGTLRAASMITLENLILQGGALKVNSSNTTYGMAAPVEVQKASTLVSGSNAASIFNAELAFTGTGDLTKSSTGTMELQKSSPKYGGNWLVEAGTLILDAAHAVGIGNVVVADTAALVAKVAGGLAGCDTLVLRKGAKLILGANDTVDHLIVGDSALRAGTYAAADIPAYLAGTGTLTVKTGGQTSTRLSKGMENGSYGLRRVGDALYYSTLGSDSRLTLYSVSGKLVATQLLADGEGSVKLSELASDNGLYIATIIQDGVVKSRTVLTK